MKKLPLILLIAFALLFIIWPFYTPDNSSNLRCIDGDTFAIGKKFYRLSYVDTPEKGDHNYFKAYKFTCEYLKSDYIKLTEYGLDKYGRTLVVVNRPYYGTETLNEKLIKECLAEPFYGNTTDKVLKLYNNCE